MNYNFLVAQFTILVRFEIGQLITIWIRDKQRKLHTYPYNITTLCLTTCKLRKLPKSILK